MIQANMVGLPRKGDWEQFILRVGGTPPVNLLHAAVFTLSATPDSRGERDVSP
jgi:hypothetical protein